MSVADGQIGITIRIRMSFEIILGRRWFGWIWHRIWARLACAFLEIISPQKCQGKQTIAQVAEALKPLCDYGAEKRVKPCLELHGEFRLASVQGSGRAGGSREFWVGMEFGAAGCGGWIRETGTGYGVALAGSRAYARSGGTGLSVSRVVPVTAREGV